MFSDTAVVLAAGRGTRMGCSGSKCLVPINGEPLLGYVIDGLLKEGAEKFIFVLGYDANEVLKFIRETHVDYKAVSQPEQKGIANAILQVEESVEDRFVVQLGDCLNLNGRFDYPNNLELGYGVWADAYTKYMNQGCRAVVSHKGIVVSVHEKPDTAYPGIGTYFLDKRIFPLIRKAKPSALRNEIEISDILNDLPVGSLKAVPFCGDFVNCTTKQDIEYAEKLLK